MNEKLVRYDWKFQDLKEYKEQLQLLIDAAKAELSEEWNQTTN